MEKIDLMLEQIIVNFKKLPERTQEELAPIFERTIKLYKNLPEKQQMKMIPLLEKTIELGNKNIISRKVRDYYTNKYNLNLSISARATPLQQGLQEDYEIN